VPGAATERALHRDSNAINNAAQCCCAVMQWKHKGENREESRQKSGNGANAGQAKTTHH